MMTRNTAATAIPILVPVLREDVDSSVADDGVSVATGGEPDGMIVEIEVVGIDVEVKRVVLGRSSFAAVCCAISARISVSVGSQATGIPSFQIYCASSRVIVERASEESRVAVGPEATNMLDRTPLVRRWQPWAQPSTHTNPLFVVSLHLLGICFTDLNIRSTA